MDGRPYRLGPGTVYVTGPGAEHTQLPDQNDPMWEYCVYLRAPEKPGRGEAQASVAPAFLATHFWFGQDTQALLPLFVGLFQAFGERRTGYQIEVQSLLQQLLVRLVRCYEQDLPTPERFSPSNRKDSSTVIIEEFFLYEYQNCSLAALADRLGLSPRQTERLLRQQYGTTFQEKRTQARMSAAAVLLVETAASVTEIAMELGYSSAEHFSGAFRRFYGLSPRAYRSAAPRVPLSGRDWGRVFRGAGRFFLSTISQKKTDKNYEKKRKSP